MDQTRTITVITRRMHLKTIRQLSIATFITNIFNLENFQDAIKLSDAPESEEEIGAI